MGNNRVTESLNVNSLSLDEMNSYEIVKLMTEEDKLIHDGIRAALPTIANAVDLIVEQWKIGGRVFVVGAGTSGRLGVLDAVELGPTFSIEENRWIALVAGGKEAMWRPLEQHEDDDNTVINELEGYNITNQDIVIGVTASGTTPYVIAAIKFADKIGCHTISISNNKSTLSSKLSTCGIELIVGPEVIRGSTRLKAGTSQKMVLNMLSTATMVRIGKVYQNQMVDMQLINKKLVQRAEQTLMDITDVSESEAKRLMIISNHNLKVALFISMTQASLEDATTFLSEANGHLKEAIQTYYNLKSN